MVLFVVSAITAIATAPAVAVEIIKLLSEKGLPLNRDWGEINRR